MINKRSAVAEMAAQRNVAQLGYGKDGVCQFSGTNMRGGLVYAVINHIYTEN